MKKYILLLSSISLFNLNAASRDPSVEHPLGRMAGYSGIYAPMPIDPVPSTPTITFSGEKAVMTYMTEKALQADNPIKYAMRAKLLSELEFVTKVQQNYEEEISKALYPEGVDKVVLSILQKIKELYNTSSKV